MSFIADKREYYKLLEGVTYFCLWAQTKPVTPRITGQECSRFVTYGHSNMGQRMLTLLCFTFDVSGSCLHQTATKDAATLAGPQQPTARQ